MYYTMQICVCSEWRLLFEVAAVTGRYRADPGQTCRYVKVILGIYSVYARVLHVVRFDGYRIYSDLLYLEELDSK